MGGESGGRGSTDGGPESGILDDDRPELAVEALRGFDEPITLADLAEAVAVRERDAPITDVSGETVADIYHSLYHTYVPRLADAGLLEYDQDTDMVHAVDDGTRDRDEDEDGDRSTNGDAD